MVLTNHPAAEKEKYEICEWHYEGDYAIYDMSSYEEMKRNQFAFANPRMHVEAFYDNDHLIGFSNLYDDGDEVFFGIGVSPAFCSRGYGTEITRMTYEISQSLFPKKPLYLEVRTWNARAIVCYQNAGFRIDGAVIHQKTHAGEGAFYRMIRK